jgi:cytochrome c-type biogenesis protein
MDIPVLTAFWLGILTSISPCPLATNIAAVSYISKDVSSKKIVILSALLYATGRMLVYFLIGLGLITALFSIMDVSLFLQDTMDIILGPIAILAGVFLLIANKMSFSGTGGLLTRVQERVAKKGVWGSLLLGGLFALAFCPITAAIFFGSLIPLSLVNTGGVMYPMFYGIGTGLPVIAFALLIAFGVGWIGNAFKKISQLETILRIATGIVFILVGLYFVFLFFEIDLIYGWFAAC